MIKSSYNLSAGNFLSTVHKTLKGTVLNYLLDRVIDFGDLFLMNVYQLPWPAAQRVCQKIFRFVGELCWLIRDFPRLPVYQLTAEPAQENGESWTIIFVGANKGLWEMAHIFFAKNQPVWRETGRVALWRLPAQSRQWLSEGVDLVICELSPFFPIRLKTSFTFAVPAMINQVLDISDPVDQLIAGKKFATERHRLNKARREGFDFKFTRLPDDFDQFHYRMYLPYIKARHGNRAVVGKYKDQRKRWFERGGLVQVTHQNRPVAGVLCYLAGDTCFDVERGVLDADPALFKKGIDTIITWSAINWAHSQGAKIYDMGASRARTSNGSFAAKRRWGARVVKNRKIFAHWTFMAGNLSQPLKDYVNNLGFISQINGKFYQVYLNDSAGEDTEAFLKNRALEMKTFGLDGVVVVSPHSTRLIGAE